MVQQLRLDSSQPIVYPESDSQLMADNTQQFRWIVTIKENLELLFKKFKFRAAAIATTGRKAPRNGG